MKSYIILIVILFNLFQIYAQKSNLSLKFTKFDSKVYALGLSSVSVQISNKGTIAETVKGQSLIEFCAQNNKTKDWNVFYELYMLDEVQETLQPGETKIIEGLTLNIFRLPCFFPNEMGDLVNKRQILNVKCFTYSLTNQELVYSDAISIEVEPLSENDKVAYDSLIVKRENPAQFTGKNLLSVGYSPYARGGKIILSDFPTSTFADLVRIGYIMYSFDPYSQESQYTLAIHNQNKKLLTEIQHKSEFEYLQYWITIAETKLAEAEKRGF
jgi:hypothetical protein